MADYTFNVYLFSPYDSGFQGPPGLFIYNPPAGDIGTVVITDNETGVDGLTLDDNVGGSQETATATITVNGVETFTDIPVNADSGWTIYDPIDDVTFEVIILNGKQGSQSFRYTLSEYPLVPGREYESINFDNQPNAQVAGDPFFTYADYVCFTPSCKLKTPTGWCSVKDLKVGDLVETLDRGAQPVRWIGSRKIAARGKNAPIRFSEGAFGCNEAFEISPKHRVVLHSYLNSLHFGDSECFAAAKHLVDDAQIVQRCGGYVEYFHILFDHHEVVNCNGVNVESFHPGKQGELLLTRDDHAKILTIFPNLADGFDNYGPAARPVLKGYETQIILNEIARESQIKAARLAA